MEKAIFILILTTIISLSILIFIVITKIPQLASWQGELPESFFKRQIKAIKRKISKSRYLQHTFWEIQAQKYLFKIRLLILRFDNITFHWLKRMRERSLGVGRKEKKSFWKRLKE